MGWRTYLWIYAMHAWSGYCRPQVLDKHFIEWRLIAFFLLLPPPPPPLDLILHVMSCKIWARHYHHHHYHHNHYHHRSHHSSWSQSSPLWLWSPHSWSSPRSAWSYLTCDVLQDRGSPQSLAPNNPDKREQLQQISKQSCCLQILSR